MRPNLIKGPPLFVRRMRELRKRRFLTEYFRAKRGEAPLPTPPFVRSLFTKRRQVLTSSFRISNGRLSMKPPRPPPLTYSTAPTSPSAASTQVHKELVHWKCYVIHSTGIVQNDQLCTSKDVLDCINQRIVSPHSFGYSSSTGPFSVPNRGPREMPSDCGVDQRDDVVKRLEPMDIH